MAESQELYPYDPINLDAIEVSLSRSRLAKYYLAAHGDRQLGLKLYLWNARLSKAFLFPLHAAEVVTRNAIHGALSKAYGATWILNIPFVLTKASQKSFDYAAERLNRTSATWGPDDLVAALSFDFWSNLFRSDYDQFWTSSGLLTRVFPELPSIYGRHDVQMIVREVNDIRNRIAHHEPVHADPALEAKHENILKLVGWSCPITQLWVRKHSTVLPLVSAKPNAVSTLPGRALGLANLRPPPTFSLETPLLTAMNAVARSRPQAGLLLDPASSPLPYRVLFSHDFMLYIAMAAQQLDGTIDLSEHKVRDVSQHADVPMIDAIARLATTGDVLARFFPSKTKEAFRLAALLVLDEGTSPSVVGIITRPDVRF